MANGDSRAQWQTPGHPREGAGGLQGRERSGQPQVLRGGGGSTRPCPRAASGGPRLPQGPERGGRTGLPAALPSPTPQLGLNSGELGAGRLTHALQGQGAAPAGIMGMSPTPRAPRLPLATLLTQRPSMGGSDALRTGYGSRQERAGPREAGEDREGPGDHAAVSHREAGGPQRGEHWDAWGAVFKPQKGLGCRRDRAPSAGPQEQIYGETEAGERCELGGAAAWRAPS